MATKTTLQHLKKEELIDLVLEFQEKLVEMKNVEKQITTTAGELSAPAIGLHKDEKGDFYLVKIRYDLNAKVAVIESLESVDTKDEAIASYKLKQYAVEGILLKARGGKYV